MNSKTFIFIGRSGCGKGTQAKILIEYLKNNPPAGEHQRDIFYFESGQRFREFFEMPGLTPTLSREIHSTGGLQPDFLAVWMWSKALIENLKENTTLVIDGSPRKLHEAHILDSALKFYKRGKSNIIFINVRREWSEEKLRGRGRTDDKNERDVKNRLDWYDSEVVPAISFFKDNPDYSFIDINGEQTIEEVHKEILNKTHLG